MNWKKIPALIKWVHELNSCTKTVIIAVLLTVLAQQPQFEKIHSKIESVQKGQAKIVQKETICFNELSKVNELLSRFLELDSRISNISFMAYHNGRETLDEIPFYSLSTFSEVATVEEIIWPNQPISIDPLLKEINQINQLGWMRLDSIIKKPGFNQLLFYAGVKSAIIYPVETLDRDNKISQIGLIVVSYRDNHIESSTEYNAKAEEIIRNLTVLLNKLKK